ncbi:invasion associated locus B family protein [Ochrobactrum quorumnocens]|uniref:invasion associated locus B family protein n=1 Tax=Ochrobactrum quorumnocens TaxID=271865 RepID=UPI001F2A3394|nr:invasion associated locus B family protein [[Ochrobactrum] quorumnocens]
MLLRATFGVVLLLLCEVIPAAAQAQNHRYFLKPSEVALPKGAQWGEIRRSIQPFENWTLICDENLKRKEKTCNVSQIITDQAGVAIFSWSLAATKNGEPFLLLRVPPLVEKQQALKVSFPGRAKPVVLDYKGCDDKICLAMLPVGPITREHIDRESDVTIGFSQNRQPVEIVVPLKGLKAALNAIH